MIAVSMKTRPSIIAELILPAASGLRAIPEVLFAIEIAIAAAPAVATIPTTAAAATALVETVLSSAVSVGAESTAGSDAWSLG